MAIFHNFVYQPFYNILVFLYNVIPGQDFGIAIIVMTIALRLALMPLYSKQVRSQKQMQELQPKIKELQKEHKNDKEKQTKELMAFYKKHKVNPFAGCLPLVVQLVVFIAIYKVLLNLSQAHLVVTPADLYAFVSNPGTINNIFFGVVDLSIPSPSIGVLAAIAQYFQTKMLLHKKTTEKKSKPQESDTEKPDFGQMMTKQMLYIGPAVTVFIGFTFPSGLALYWLVSTLFMLLQQVMMTDAQDEKK